MSKRINAVLFDLGETILNFGKVNTNKLFGHGAKLTYEYLKNMSQPVGDFKKYSRKYLSAIKWKYYLSFFTGKDFNALELLKKIGVSQGLNLSEEQWRHILWLWYEPLSKAAAVEENIKESLSKLKQKGLKLGILSNTFINASVLDYHMEKFGLLDFFDIRLYSYKFPFRKPDLRIFRAAADKIGEKCENIMFIGDRINKDVKPALRAGMTAVLKKAHTNFGKQLPGGAYRIENISELPALIDTLNA